MQYTHFGFIFIRQSIALRLRRRHKAKANLQCTDKAQNNSETRVRALFALYKNIFFFQFHSSMQGRKSQLGTNCKGRA